MKPAGWVTTLLITMLACASAHGQQPSRALDFDLPAQPLGDSLNDLAVQSGLQIIFYSEVTDGMNAGRLSGRYTTEDALKRLLAGTVLEYRFVSGRTIEIRRGKPAARRQPAPTSREMEQVTITGTHIPGATPQTSPAMVYEREQIEHLGVSTIEELLRKIPQHFALVGPDTLFNSGDNVQAGANSVRGVAVNLRGFGSGSTLVLVNGHRVAPAGTDGSFVDVSLIPLSAVERVEILTEGVSAVYGADAVAGVVNFVLRRSFDGAETRLRYSGTARGGADEPSVAQLFGWSWLGGDGLIAYEHHRQAALDASDRGFIPPQLARFMVLPEQRRNSAYLSGKHGFSDGVELVGDATYSERQFVHDSVNGGFVSFASGATRHVGASVSVRAELGHEWRARLLLHHSDQENYADTVTHAVAGEHRTRLEQRAKLTSADIHSDGPLFSIAGGEVRASAGAGVRREEFDDFARVGGAGTGLRRFVVSAYGEALVPLTKQLELSAAARYERYDTFSSLNPKVAVLWSAVKGLKVRGSYSTSFRVAPLTQGSEHASSALLATLVNPDDADGTNALIIFGGNRTLHPEKAKNFTIGVEVEPEAVRGLSLSATYFELDYTDRVSVPPIQGSPLTLFSQASALASFLNLSPTGEEIAGVFARYPVMDHTGEGPEGVDAIYDGRFQNIAAVFASGLTLTGSYGWNTARNDYEVFVVADRLLRLDSQAVSTAPRVALEGRPFNPMTVRMRGAGTVSRGALTSSLGFNFMDSEDSGSWLTADVYASYRAKRGLAFNFAIQNVADRDPPLLPRTLSSLAYDATNASPLGRVVTVELRKRW